MRQILLVDDDPDLLGVISETMHGEFLVHSAQTLAAAEHILTVQSQALSAVILDIRMPDGDGRNLCARMRQSGSTIPIILVSGLDSESDVARGLDEGADAYVAKPFAPSELLARLRHLCSPP